MFSFMSHNYLKNDHAPSSCEKDHGSLILIRKTIIILEQFNFIFKNIINIIFSLYCQKIQARVYSYYCNKGNNSFINIFLFKLTIFLIQNPWASIGFVPKGFTSGPMGCSLQWRPLSFISANFTTQNQAANMYDPMLWWCLIHKIFPGDGLRVI